MSAFLKQIASIGFTTGQSFLHNKISIKVSSYRKRLDQIQLLLAHHLPAHLNKKGQSRVSPVGLVTRIVKCDNPLGERVTINQYAVRRTRERHGPGCKVVVRYDHGFIAPVMLHAGHCVAYGTAGNLRFIALDLDGDLVASPCGNEVHPKVTTALGHAHTVALSGEKLLEISLEVNAGHHISGFGQQCRQRTLRRLPNQAAHTLAPSACRAGHTASA